MNTSILHYYRQFRAHQFATFSDSGECIDGRSTRTFTGGGAAYGFHAMAAYQSARAHIHFRAWLAKEIKPRRGNK
jgi:hypothetical protein